MAASSATAASSALGFLVASPIPTLSTIFTSFGTSCGFFEPHHFRRRERRGQLDDAALLVRRGSALVLLHDVHALHHHPELLGVYAQHLPFFPPMLARDHAHRVAFGDVQLVALGLPRPGAAAALLEDERLHVRSPRSRATRSS